MSSEREFVYPYRAPPGFRNREEIKEPPLYPLLNIQLYTDPSRPRHLEGLLDSGADVCLFPSEVGESLGIAVEEGERGSITGIGETAYPTFAHSLVIIIGPYQRKIRAWFCDAVPTPLLGQRGFFEHFEVKFNARKLKMEIIPHSRPE